MIRRVFRIGSAVSLSLCAAVVAIGIAGAVHPRLVKFQRPGRPPIWLRWTGEGIIVGPVWYVDSTAGIVSFDHAIVRVDCWILGPLFGVLGILPYANRPLFKKRVGSSEPTCEVCGYDLRASKERCPECGTPVKPRPTRPWYDPGNS